MVQRLPHRIAPVDDVQLPSEFARPFALPGVSILVWRDAKFRGTSTT
ncbi:Uncharacterised protein [Mycolicibacterium flavescens]|nr:Uncharacterised protein [Mycolicibacterium flavescens]